MISNEQIVQQALLGAAGALIAIEVLKQIAAGHNNPSKLAEAALRRMEIPQ